MKLQKLILPAILIGLFAAYKRTASDIDIANQFSISLGGLDFNQIEPGVFSTTIFPNVIVTNPTTASTTIDSISGSLLINGVVSGTYYLSNIAIVPGINNITLPVKISNGNTLYALINYFVNGMGNVLKISTAGILNKGAFNLKFDQVYNIQPLRKSDQKQNVAVSGTVKGHYAINLINGLYHIVFLYPNGKTTVITKGYKQVYQAQRALNKMYNG